MTNHKEETNPGQTEPRPDAHRTRPLGGGFHQPTRSLAQRDWQQLRDEIERAGRRPEAWSTH